MARVTEKDRKIQKLETEVEFYKDKSSKRKAWESLPQNKKLAIVIGIVLLSIAVVISFYIEIVNATSIGRIDDVDYQALLMKTGSVKWKAQKRDLPVLKRLLGKSLTGNVFTTAEDGMITLEFEGSSLNLWGEFCLDDGYISGLVDGRNAKLFFSESLLRTGRALSLYINGEKIVFYECI